VNDTQSQKHLIATYCARNKTINDGLEPAHKRYISERIDMTREAAKEPTCLFAILSGSFGLIDGDELIPHYDHLLQEDEIQSMVLKVTSTLIKWEVTHITWYSLPDELDPYVWRYRKVITNSAKQAGCHLKTVDILKD